jgi:predicted ATP-grasp superfamily ATP-dependent carboligase
VHAIVLDGNENQAVAATRSLRRAGHDVSVGAHTAWSKAGWSRAAGSTFVYTAPQEDAAAFVACIAEEARRVEGTLVLPMTERTTLPLSAARATLHAAGARIVLPSHETLLRAFDKQQTTRLAESLGVVVPQTALVETEEQARAFAASNTTRYPVVLKPRTSEEMKIDGSVSATGAPAYARDAREFIEAYGRMRERASSVLAQEFVEGAGVGYFALMREGSLRAEFAHRRLRDVRPTGSGSALRESARPDERVRAASLKILNALGWHGVAMVEFRVRADGTPVFLEVNGRFWNSLALAIHAGVDFPSMLAEMAERGDVGQATDYKTGVRCRWLLGDFRHLVEVWRGAPAGYTGAFPKRWPTLLNFLTPARGTFHDNFNLRDPAPELGDWLDFLLRKLPAGIKKRQTARKDLHVQRGYSLP